MFQDLGSGYNCPGVVTSAWFSLVKLPCVICTNMLAYSYHSGPFSKKCPQLLLPNMLLAGYQHEQKISNSVFTCHISRVGYSTVFYNLNYIIKQLEGIPHAPYSWKFWTKVVSLSVNLLNYVKWSSINELMLVPTKKTDIMQHCLK